MWRNILGLHVLYCCCIAYNSGHTHSYKEILFPVDSGLRMDGLHIWPRNSHMMMALANLDGSMTGTLYMDTTGGRYGLILTMTTFFCCVFIAPAYRGLLLVHCSVHRSTR